MKKEREGTIEVLVRGVFVDRGKLLLCHSKGATNTYLPGGLVEFDESSEAALAREIREEMGRKANVGRFLGAVEHSFRQRGVRHCEVNLVFETEISGLTSRRIPESKEEKIDFRWISLSALARSNLEPRPLRRLLRKWMEKKGVPERWGSSRHRRDTR